MKCFTILSRFSLFCNNHLRNEKGWPTTLFYLSKRNVQLLTENDVNYDEHISIRKRKRPYSSKHYEAINMYLNSKPCLIKIKDKIPPDFLKRKSKGWNNRPTYIVDSDVSRELFETIYPYLRSDNGHILEINSGIGVLTNLLLEAKLPRLRIYEADSSLYKALEAEVHKQNSDAKIFKSNLLALWLMIKQDRHDNGNRVNTAFSGISPISWEDDPVMKIIVTITSEHFIMQLIYSIIFQNGFSTYGRPELFVVMPSEVYWKLVATPNQGFQKYRSKSVLFQLIFDYCLLKKLPAKAFVPWMEKKPLIRQKKNTEEEKEDSDLFYLVRITARSDLHERIPDDLLKHFFFYVQLVMYRRKEKLIACMEKWIPGCGVQLIKQGYTIFTPCGSITPEEILKIFQKFSSLPEFHTCFCSSNLENILMKATVPGIAEEILLEKRKRKRYKDLIEDQPVNLEDVISDDIEDESGS